MYVEQLKYSADSSNCLIYNHRQTLARLRLRPQPLLSTPLLTCQLRLHPPPGFRLRLSMPRRRKRPGCETAMSTQRGFLPRFQPDFRVDLSSPTATGCPTTLIHDDYRLATPTQRPTVIESEPIRSRSASSQTSNEIVNRRRFLPPRFRTTRFSSCVADASSFLHHQNCCNLTRNVTLIVSRC